MEPLRLATVFWGFVVLRLVNALAVWTFFNPDEYWQSLEPAHRLVFGYGHLTWEWAAGLRGYAHPLVFAAFYKLLQVTGTDTAFATSRGPKLLQGLFAATCDTYVFLISRDVYGERTARFAALCQAASWFNFYCLTRTYSNSMEAALLTGAVYHWGLHIEEGRRGGSSRRGQRLGLLAAAASVVMRPACAAFWLLVGCWRLRKCRADESRLGLVGDAVGIGGLVLGLSLLVDRLYYGRWVYVMWEFVKFNLLQGGSSLYGSHPWHWNFSQGFPAIAASYVPLMALGAFVGGRPLIRMAAIYVGLMSLPAHKEFRFLLPALQLAIPSSAAGLELLLSPSHRRRRQLRRAAAFVCLLLQAAAASYLSLVHQRGAVSVMDVLASKARGGGGLSAVFLMPCHSTPFHSHVHSRGAAMAFLDCSPPGWAHKTHELNALPGGEGEGRCQPRLLRASDFDADPVGFTRRLLAAGEAAGGGGEGGPLGACPLPPGHVVTFDAVGEVLRPLLEGLGYREVARLFQSHFTVDHNGLQRSVLVYERLHAP